MDRAVEVVELEQGPHERAAVEVIMVKPLVEGVEECEQPLSSGGGEARDLDLQPLPRPAPFA
jgi:hypothetical protein